MISNISRIMRTELYAFLENEENKKLYENNPEFYTFVEFLQQGINNMQLLSIIAQLCKNNQNLAELCAGYAQNSIPKIIILKEGEKLIDGREGRG
jgi:hypothetical protein